MDEVSCLGADSRQRLEHLEVGCVEDSEKASIMLLLVGDFPVLGHL